MAREKVPDGVFFRRDLLDNREPATEHRGWATHAVCSEVLEHVPDPVQLLRSANGYLAAGCVLIVTVPGGPMSPFDRYIGHRQHFTPQDLRQVLVEAGFSVERVWRAGFPFFNLYRLLVIARGRRLADDVRAGQPSRAADAAMAVFRVLFRLNFDRPAWGWQVVGIARL